MKKLPPQGDAMTHARNTTARSFLRDVQGNISLIAALSLPVLVLSVGGGIDMSHAYSVRQELTNVVELSCSQSGREISYQRGKPENASRPASDFRSTANRISARRLSASGLGGTIRNTISGDVLTVTGSAESANSFAVVLGAETTPVGVVRSCSVARPDPSTTPGTLLFMESFESNHPVGLNRWAIYQNWNGWDTEGTRGIEINGLPELSAGTIRFGNFFAELDSWANSTMSRRMRLAAGEYEIRYWYISRVRNPDPAYAGALGCGSGAALEPYRAWRNETNRIDLYVERSGNYTYAPANMVDSCVYTDQWVERRIRFRVASEAEYRISWKAAGQNESTGGLIDYIRICSRTCP